MSRTAVKFAAFTIVCVLFTGYLAVVIGNIRLFEDSYTVTATFDDVTGLLTNDNVKIAGVVVGKVTGIDVEGNEAVVTMEVKNSVRLPTDSAAAVRWRNLLGQRYVYLYPGTASTVLGSGERIARTSPVVDLGELFNRLGPIVAAIDPKQVNAFLDGMYKSLEGNAATVGRTLDDLGVVVDALGKRDEAIGHLVENVNTVAGTIATRDRQIRSLLDNLVEISQTFSANVDVVDASITDVGDVSERLAALLGANRAHIDRTLASLVTTLHAVRQKLPVLERAVGNLDEAAAAIYRAGSYGEFLNQAILCATTGGWEGGEPPCPGAVSGLGASPAGAPRAPSIGARAIVDLVKVSR